MNDSKRRNATLLVYAGTPIILLASFVFLYQGHKYESDRKEKLAAEAAALADAKKAAQQRELEAQLEEQARTIAAAKAKALAAKEARIKAEKAEKLAEANQRLAETRNRISGFSSNLKELEARIETARKKRTEIEHAHVALAVETARLAASKDAADLETQRLTKRLSYVVDSEIEHAIAQASSPL